MRWTVNKKLIFLVLLNLLAIAVVSTIGYRSLAEVVSSGKSLLATNSVLRAQTDADMSHDAINSIVHEAIINGAGLSSSRNPEDVDKAQRATLVAFGRHNRIIERSVGVVQAGNLWSGSLDKSAAVHADLGAYVVLAEKIIKLASTDPTSARAMLPEFRAAFSRLETEMGEISDRIEAAAAVNQADAERRSEFAVMLLIASGVIAVMLVAFFALLIARSIVIPLTEAVEVAKAVAAGDLRGDIKVRSRDEVGELMQAFKDMTQGLNQRVVHVTEEVGRVSRSIVDSANQLSAGNETLASRTEAQASSVEETVASIEEVAAAAKQNAEHAQQGKNAAEEVSNVFRRGNEVVSQLTDTMAQINLSSKRVAEITALIDGIAFQTNILALNASVEAARAGDLGRGFSVVASEVRNLAQRSAAAAQEIKTLVNDSVGKADSGSILAKEARQAMEASVEAVSRVAALMLEIASASKEQSEGVEQINQAMAQIDQATQQNAALMEEASATTEILGESATHLLELTSLFKTGAEPGEVAQRKTLPRSHRAAVAGRQDNSRRSPARQLPRQAAKATSETEENWAEF
jgi:methyl-accepting chemotaxis protein